MTLTSTGSEGAASLLPKQQFSLVMLHLHCLINS